MNSFFQKFFILIIITISIYTEIISQDSVIKLTNPSFEGEPTCCKTPMGWIDCGWKDQSPPDIQPMPEGEEPLFGVTTKAFDGKTYLGMVIRDNGTHERVGQKLSQKLIKGKCYKFSIYICRSKEYVSASTTDNITLKNFINPIKLRIIAGSTYCELTELLAESEEILNNEWEEYSFEFSPNADYNYFHLEAYYIDEDNPVNGNILLDKASNIELIPCE